MTTRSCLIALVSAAGAAAIAGWIFIRFDADGFSARSKPTEIETVLATFARGLAVPNSAKHLQNPVPESERILSAARDYWAGQCEMCHGEDGSGNTPIGHSLYPPPPDLRGKSIQSKSDGELFYVIRNGIRMSGMPARDEPNDKSENSWALVRFVRYLASQKH